MKKHKKSCDYNFSPGVRTWFASIFLLFFPVLALSQAGPGTGVFQNTGSPFKMQLQGEDKYRLRGSHRPAPTASPVSQLPYASEVEAAAKVSRLDPVLVHALIAVESGHRQDAVSPKGAVGLMQLMPGTAIRYGVRAPGRSSGENILAGTRYLRDLLDMFDNRIDLALAAYNAGEGAVLKYGNRIPPYRETQNYVPSVLELYDAWRQPEPVKQQSIMYLPGTHLDRTGIQDFLLRRE